jgi:Ca2+-binding EF-hand superfamily protein
LLKKVHQDKEKIMVSGVDGVMPDPSTIWQSLLKKADKNGDGKISKEEFMANAPQGANDPKAADLFKQIDTNGDGFIDETESKAALKKMHHHGHHHKPDPAAMFKEADTNGDGEISLDEFKTIKPQGASESDAEAMFKSGDTNSDGSISLDEFKAMISKQDSFSALA